MENSKQKSTRSAGANEFSLASLAVLPFTNISGEKEIEFLPVAITDQLTSYLAAIKELKVASKTSSAAVQKKGLDVEEIGKTLNVYYLLEGSVVKSRDKVRVVVQLVSVIDGFQIWSEIIEHSIDDILTILDDICTLLVKKICKTILFGKSNVGEDEHKQLSVFHYKTYLKGKFYVNKTNKLKIRQGISLLNNLVTEYPGYTQAYLQLFEAYLTLSKMGIMDTKEAKTLAEVNLKKALNIEPELAECYKTQALMSFYFDWDLESAHQLLRNAIKLNPENSENYTALSIFYMVEKKFSDAIRSIDKSLEIDSIAGNGNFYKAKVYYYQGKYELVVKKCNDHLSIEPDHFFAKLLIIWSIIVAGKSIEAIEYISSLPLDEQKNNRIVVCHAIARYYLGEVNEIESAIKIFKNLLNSEEREMAQKSLIRLYSVTGETNKAFELIKEMIEYKSPSILLLPLDPIVKHTFNDPRVQKLIEQEFSQISSGERLSKKYNKSTLSKADLDFYYDKLEFIIKTEKPFLDQNLNRNKLAKFIGLHPNQLSQLLNERVGLNFSEYINSHRLQAFISKTKDPENHQLTILALAFESGFTSKTVFNTFFKNKMGVTPSTYWKSVIDRK